MPGSTLAPTVGPVAAIAMRPPATAKRASKRGHGPAASAVVGTLEVVWDDALAAYDFGPGHPLDPVRIELTVALAREPGVFDAPGVSLAV